MRAFITILAIINSSLAIKSRLALDKEYQGAPHFQAEYRKLKMSPKQVKEYVEKEIKNLETFETQKRGEKPKSKKQ